MKHIVRKLFWDYEKEEKWLGDMASKGLAFTAYKKGRYEFEDSKKDEYIYRLELLKHDCTHPESREYISFVCETGAEFVASNKRWVYFRKKASEGSFDLYSDIESKLAHYKRVSTLMTTSAFVNLSAGLLCGRFLFPQAGVNYTTVDLIFGIVGVCLIVMSTVLSLLSIPIYKKIKRLKEELEIRES